MNDDIHEKRKYEMKRNSTRFLSEKSFLVELNDNAVFDNLSRWGSNKRVYVSFELGELKFSQMANFEFQRIKCCWKFKIYLLKIHKQ